MEYGEEPQLKKHSAADRSVDTIIDYISLQPLQIGLNLINRYRNRLNALEATLLANNSHDNGASRSNNESLLGRGSTQTKREAKKRAARADAVKLNPELGDDLAAGEMGVEQLDAIASASDRTKGAAARDQTLIDEIKKGNADDAKKLADTYVDDHLTPEQHETRRKKQRRLRRLRRGFSDRGTETLTAEGDTETIDEMYKVLLTFADRLYKRDGGRDIPAGEHPRTHGQRLYDACHQLVTGEHAPTDQEIDETETEDAEVETETACPEGPLRCHAHHLTPVNAPAHGETDIDKLALLCGDCHRFVHDNNLTLYKDPDGIWKTRLATPEETPRKRRRPERKPPTPTGSSDPPGGRSPPDTPGSTVRLEHGPNHTRTRRQNRPTGPASRP